MSCYKHSDKKSVCACGKCGKWLCEDCAIEIGGRVLCKQCLEAAIDEKGYYAEKGAEPNVNPYSAGYPHTHECSEYYRNEEARPARGRVPGTLGLVITSCILPGVGYMYLGLLKRGLFCLSSFFLLAYLSGFFNAPIFGMAIVVLWFGCFFDGLRKRRLLLEGETVEDGVGDIVEILKKHKVIVGIALLFGVFSGISHRMLPLAVGHIGIGSLMPLFLIGAGVYVFIKILRK